MTPQADTIYALSSPPGRGGVAVVRVSGPQSLVALKNLSGKIPLPRQAALRRLKDPESEAPIDEALILYFAAPHSFTGEEVVEYQIHGGRAVVEYLLRVLSRQPGHRPALPGEFTRRAFEHGRLDLTEAEAIADLINAETEAQRLQALSQLSGALGSLYGGWTERLKRTLAYLEADLDFSDQDLPDDLLVKIRPDLSDLAAAIAGHLNDARRGERLREGFRLVILGAPNAGKSTLINALAQREVAIVSPLAGTTRDVIDTHLDIGGFPVILSDTAGLRLEQIQETGHDAIESEGIRRARFAAQNADLKILLFDGTGPVPDPHTMDLLDDRALLVLTKADQPAVLKGLINPLKISALNGQGLDDLLHLIEGRLRELAGPRDTPTLTRARHRAALEKAHEALLRSETAPLPELAAEDLRLAIRHLGSITGRVDVEDLLDVIFRDFCIGK